MATEVTGSLRTGGEEEIRSNERSGNIFHELEIVRGTELNIGEQVFSRTWNSWLRDKATLL